MSDKQKAFDDLKRFANSFSGVLAMAAELAEVGSIEQAAEEAKARHAQATKAAAEAVDRARKAELDRAKAEAAAKERTVSAQKEIDELNAKVAQARADANSGADRVLENAKAQAMRIMEDAHATAIRTEKDAKRRIETDGERQMAAINDRIAAANKQHAEIAAQIKPAADQLAAIQAEIARVKAKFG